MTFKPHLIGKKGNITQKQYDTMVSLWGEVSRAKDYDSLRTFIRKVTNIWYLWLENMSRVDAGHMIAILKEWKAKK